MNKQTHTHAHMYEICTVYLLLLLLLFLLVLFESVEDSCMSEQGSMASIEFNFPWFRNTVINIDINLDRGTAVDADFVIAIVVAVVIVDMDVEMLK
jgi:hypothetical protein